jgi:hydrogenase/urease accessory protein HupE
MNAHSLWHSTTAVTGFLVTLMLISIASAHEIRPAYLQVDEIGPGRYQLLWRTPLLSGMRLPVVLLLPDEFRHVTEPATQQLSDSLIEHHVFDVGAQGVTGKRIEFAGLQATITDVLVRVQMLDGADSTTLVRPSQPWVDMAGSQGWFSVARTYVVHGIEHILLGADHLLFVLGLVLLVKNRWMLIKTITAFTVAHSITLAVATFGYASIPVPPLNVAIALSILFLGPEIVRAWRGGTSLTIRQPWVVAFAFGLLHGFGFASGLTQMGLPQNDIPLALLSFNVGVELGQIGFVALILLLERSFRVLDIRWSHTIELLPAYAVGSLGAFWTIDRLIVMVGGRRESDNRFAAPIRCGFRLQRFDGPHAERLARRSASRYDRLGTRL